MKRSLTPAQVREIKKRLDKREAALEVMKELTYPAIAEATGTTPQIVERIDAGRTYKHEGNDW